MTPGASKACLVIPGCRRDRRSLSLLSFFVFSFFCRSLKEKEKSLRTITAGRLKNNLILKPNGTHVLNFMRRRVSHLCDGSVFSLCFVKPPNRHDWEVCEMFENMNNISSPRFFNSCLVRNHRDCHSCGGCSACKVYDQILVIAHRRRELLVLKVPASLRRSLVFVLESHPNGRGWDGSVWNELTSLTTYNQMTKAKLVFTAGKSYCDGVKSSCVVISWLCAS